MACMDNDMDSMASVNLVEILLLARCAMQEGMNDRIILSLRQSTEGRTE